MFKCHFVAAIVIFLAVLRVVRTKFHYTFTMKSEQKMNELFNGSKFGSNNLTGIHQGETLIENILVGVIYISISLFYLGPYVMCMVLIYTDKKLISKPYYLIVVNMGLTDIIQLLFNGMTAGIFTLFADLITFWMNKFVGGLMNFCWVMYCFLAHLLALNRFVNLFWPMHVNLVFSLRNTKILIILTWIYGLSWFTAYMCPDFNLLYLPETYNWDYDETKSSRLGWLVELINDSFHAVSMVVWYTLIFIKLKFRVIFVLNLVLIRVFLNQIHNDF